MVQIGVMRVGMQEGLVLVRMGVGLDTAPLRSMLVLVVLVMAVTVAVGQRFMPMGMIMAFGDMEPDADGHQYGGYPEKGARTL